MIEEMTPHGQQLESPSQHLVNPSDRETSQILQKGEHIPVQNIIGNRSGVDAEKFVVRLSELNEAHTETIADSKTSLHYITQTQFKALQELLKGPEKNKFQKFCDMWEQCLKPILLSWPRDELFPVLDLIRWQFGQEVLQGLSIDVSSEILHVFMSSKHRFFSFEAGQTTLLLTLRIIANFFLHSSLHKLLEERREDIVGHLNKLVEDSATPNEGDLNVQDNKGKYSLK